MSPMFGGRADAGQEGAVPSDNGVGAWEESKQGAQGPGASPNHHFAFEEGVPPMSPVLSYGSGTSTPQEAKSGPITPQKLFLGPYPPKKLRLGLRTIFRILRLNIWTPNI